MVNGVPAQKHHYNVPWVIFAVVIALCVVAYLYWKYQVPEDRARRDVAPQASESRDETSAFGSQSAIGNTTEAVTEVVSESVGETPDLNPLKKINPFSGKANPFE